MKFSPRSRFLLHIGISAAAGIVIGGYLFADTQPRSFLAFHKCEGTCLDVNELIGLAASAGIQKLAFMAAPVVIRETEKTVVIRHPFPVAELHYVVIPKKDIQDAADITDADKEYLFDAYAAMRDIIRKENLFAYKIITNGPGFQTVNYLHFHLIADLE